MWCVREGRERGRGESEEAHLVVGDARLVPALEQGLAQLAALRQLLLQRCALALRGGHGLQPLCGV